MRPRRYIDVMDRESVVQVMLKAVRVDLSSNTPVLLLKELEGDRSLAIFVGAPEATAIAYAVGGVEVPRPMTHDLLVTILESLSASLERVVVTELIDRTYYAELSLLRGTEPIAVSCRPSDAVAVALRAGAPIFVSTELMDQEGLVIDDEDDDEEVAEEAEDLVGMFREFLDSIDPEDFQP